MTLPLLKTSGHCFVDCPSRGFAWCLLGNRFRVWNHRKNTVFMASGGTWGWPVLITDELTGHLLSPRCLTAYSVPYRISECLGWHSETAASLPCQTSVICLLTCVSTDAGFLFCSVRIISYCHCLLWSSCCPTRGQWDSLHPGSCIFLTCSLLSIFEPFLHFLYFTVFISAPFQVL